MQARRLVLLGLLLATAVGILGAIWRPYAEAGISDAAIRHFSALTATLVAIMLPFLAAGWAASTASGAGGGSPFSAIITFYFLAWNAAISLFLLVLTYMGMRYAAFWSGEAIDFALFGIVIAFGRHVGNAAQERDSNASLLRRRKEAAIRELEELRQRHTRSADHPERASVLAAADALLEELRLLPLHGVAEDGGGVFGRTAKWRIAAEGYLRASDAENSGLVQRQLVAEASSIARSLAYWKH